MEGKSTRTVVGLIGLALVFPQVGLVASSFPAWPTVLIDHVHLKDLSVVKDGVYRPRVEGDKYVMELTQNRSFTYSGLDVDIRSGEDFLVEGTFRAVVGPMASHGVMWKADWKRMWWFEISPSGVYSVIRMDAWKQGNHLYGNPVELVNRQPCEHIKRTNPWGENPWNKLRAVGLNNKLQLYINNMLVKELPLQSTPITTVGAGIAGQTKVELSRFLVKRTGVHLKEVVACLGIGNINGAGPVTAEGIGGHSYGKAGSTFRSGDTIWILSRFGNLPVGKHTLHAKLFHGKGANMRTEIGWWQTLQFENTETAWAYWFASPGASSGHWTVHIALDGRALGHVEYGVDMPLE